MPRTTTPIHLTPAEYFIAAVGGPRAGGRYVGKSHASVIGWRQNDLGSIPHDSQITILRKAREDGLDITAEDLIMGRTIQQPAA